MTSRLARAAAARRVAALLLLGASLLLPAAARAQEGPTLKRIKANGTIVLGIRDAATPFSFLDKSGKPVGYHLDLCAHVVDRVKGELGLKELAVKYVSVNPQTRIPMLAAGSIDLECGATTNTLTRQQQVDFSYVTFISATRLLVRRDSGIKEIEDLDGKVVALALGTTNEQAVRKLIADKHLNVKVVNVKDHPEGFAAVQTDRADAYATDDTALYAQISTAKDPKSFAVVGRELTYEPLGLMMPRNDSEFARLVNASLADLFRSGEIKPIYDKWLDPIGMKRSPLFDAAIQLQAIPN